MANVVVESLRGVPICGRVLLILAVSIVAAKTIELLVYLTLRRSGQLTGRNYEDISPRSYADHCI